MTENQCSLTPWQALQRLLTSAPGSGCLDGKALFVELAHAGYVADDATLIIAFALSTQCLTKIDSAHFRPVYRVNDDRLPAVGALLTGWQARDQAAF